MGSRGPVPKRSDQRVRRNADETAQIEKVLAEGPVQCPPLGIFNPHPLVVDLYDSLNKSAQSRYYEPSDWHYARLTCELLSQQLNSGKVSAMMMATLNTMMSNLLLTEGDRRRVRLEVERDQAAAEVVDIAAVLAARQSQ